MGRSGEKNRGEVVVGTRGSELGAPSGVAPEPNGFRRNYCLKYLRPVLVETARNKQTTGLGHVTVADMKRLRVCWPGKAILTAFDRQVGPIFDKVFCDTLESQTLATLRDALLPKLICGELRVPDAERIVGRAR